MSLVIRICSMLFCSFTLCAHNVVLISGSTGGIGLEMVQTFQKNGWSVWAGYRSDVPQEFLDTDGIHPIYLDVTDSNSILSCVNTVIAKEGKIDALINNAGYGILGADELIPCNEAEKLFDVNFFGALRLIQTTAPWMKQQKSGHIINISSTSGVRAVPGLGMYAASKFAMEGLSESLAVTLSPWNIHVVLVEPGTVNNNWAEHCKSDDSELAAKLLSKLVQLSSKGQDCSEIASLVYSVAINTNPDMRYQTSNLVKTALKEKLVDLSGNTMKSKQIAFFNTLMSGN